VNQRGMPKKKKGGGKKGKGKGKAVDVTAPGYIPSTLSERFRTVAGVIGLQDSAEDGAVVLHEALEPTEDVPCFTELRLSNRALGPGGTRALSIALLGVGPGMDPYDVERTILVPPDGTCCYRQLTALTLEENRCLDGGAGALASLLTPHAVARGLSLATLTVRGDNFGPIACEPLAVGLSWSSPLTSLAIEYNPGIDDASVRRLCAGLSLNGSLTKLSLAYCGYGAGGAHNLARLLSRSEITSLRK
jgi:hypothetical protein